MDWSDFENYHYNYTHHVTRSIYRLRKNLSGKPELVYRFTPDGEISPSIRFMNVFDNTDELFLLVYDTFETKYVPPGWEEPAWAYCDRLFLIRKDGSGFTEVKLPVPE